MSHISYAYIDIHDHIAHIISISLSVSSWRYEAPGAAQSTGSIATGRPNTGGGWPCVRVVAVELGVNYLCGVKAAAAAAARGTTTRRGVR